MSNFADLVRVRNKHTGQVGYISRTLFENPRVNAGILEEIDLDAKPYYRPLYKSKFLTETVEEAETAGADSSDPDDSEDE